MEITDEVRRAVLEETCSTEGCDFDLSEAIGTSDRPNPNDPRGMPMRVLRSSVAGRLPHLRCRRCGRVWLVIDEPGRGYDDAVAVVADRLQSLAPDNVGPLNPVPFAGSADRPIPLSRDVSWSDLAESHPSKVWQAVVDDHDAATGPVVEPDPAAAQPEPDSVQIITTAPEESP